MQAVLNAPGCAFIIEIETVPAPRMTDEVMDGTKSIKGPCKTAVEQGMKALSGGDGRSDFQSLMGAYIAAELFVAFIWLGTSQNAIRPAWRASRVRTANRRSVSTWSCRYASITSASW